MSIENIGFISIFFVNFLHPYFINQKAINVYGNYCTIPKIKMQEKSCTLLYRNRRKYNIVTIWSNKKFFTIIAIICFYLV